MKTKVHCDKEVEIAVIARDVKYIRLAVEGNGNPGLIEQTRANTDFRIETEAKAKVVKFLVGGGWVTTLIALVIALL